MSTRPCLNAAAAGDVELPTVWLHHEPQDDGDAFFNALLMVLLAGRERFTGLCLGLFHLKTLLAGRLQDVCGMLTLQPLAVPTTRLGPTFHLFPVLIPAQRAMTGAMTSLAPPARPRGAFGEA